MKSKIYHSVERNPKYHTVGTTPKYHTTGKNPQSKWRNVERDKTDTLAQIPALLGTDTKIKSGGAKLVLWDSVICHYLRKHSQY